MQVKCISIELVYMAEDLYREYPRYAYNFVGLTDAINYDKGENFPTVDTLGVIGVTDDLYKINNTYTMGAPYEGPL